MNSMIIKLSCDAAFQKAYKGQIKCPQMVYQKKGGLFACMPLSMWRMFRPGVPMSIVESVPQGMRIGGVPEEEVKSLRDIISYHNNLYYKEARQDITDQAFDQLYRRLRDLEDEHPELRDPNSPTRHVGSDI